ncbi:hypothetical protein EPUL_006114 [Erysiphe pulchra]|uniref:Integrase catalytic domain-containing protein n=1 Tax=Erysiphe pulchra TaxID=225359 RepID=A0A2S4PJI4_9PEZI|nr:hypothetical protein EPUL_006114 [Erysiphe pulchra]
MAKYQSFLAEWEGVEGMVDSEEDEVNQFLLEMSETENDFDNNNCQNNHRQCEYFVTEFGPANPHHLIRHLNNQSTLHAITGRDIFRCHNNDEFSIESSKTTNTVWNVENSILPRYSSTKFQGIIPETGAAGVSTVGHPQVIALQKLNASIQIDKSRAGTVEVNTPIGSIFNLEGNNLLHTIDESTNYQAARFLVDITAFTVWNAFRASWIDVYLGSPDFIVHDAGTNFVSKEFRHNARSMGISVQEFPVEAHNSIGKVERYHSPLRRAYKIILDELNGHKVPKEIILQMAVKAMNDSVGPHGLIPTLLVYGAYPRMTKDSAPSPSVTVRAEAINKAMKEIARIRAKRSVKNALITRNGPNTLPIMNAPINSEVLVWRENKRWNGPYLLIATDVDHQECVVQLPHGPTRFRSTVVKPFNQDESDSKSDECIKLSTNTLYLNSGWTLNQIPGQVIQSQTLTTNLICQMKM